MDLAFNLLLTILLELPVVGFFFVRKKRKNALLVCLLTNLVTWPIINILRLNTEINSDIIAIAVVAAEGAAYWFFLETGFKKGLLMSFVANLLSYILTRIIFIPGDYWQGKPDIIVH